MSTAQKPESAEKIQKQKLKAVISAVGPDRPGIVAAITQALMRHDANIEDSTMTQLANEFAVIMIVTLSEDSPLESLEHELYHLEPEWGMTFTIKPLDTRPARTFSGLPYLISVAGSDRMGITYHVSHILARHEVNITDLNAQIIQGEQGPVYIMMVEVTLPEGTSVTTLEKAFADNPETASLEINMRPLENISL